MPGVGNSFRALEGDARLDWWEDCGIALSEYELAGRPAVARYEVEGENVAPWTVVVGSESATCRVFEGQADAPDVRIRMSADNWLDITAGRSSIWALIRSGVVQVGGDRRLLGVL